MGTVREKVWRKMCRVEREKNHVSGWGWRTEIANETEQGREAWSRTWNLCE